MAWPGLRNYSDAAAAKTALAARARHVTREPITKSVQAHKMLRGLVTFAAWHSAVYHETNANVFMAIDNVALALESGKKWRLFWEEETSILGTNDRVKRASIGSLPLDDVFARYRIKEHKRPLGGFRLWRPKWLEEGGSQKADGRNKISWFVTVTRGAGGNKKSEILRTSYMESPL